MPKDLRTYLEQVKDYTLRVTQEVDVVTQVAELCSQSNQPILFENLKGYPGWRLVDSLLRARELQGIALGCDPKQVVQEFARLQAKGPGPTRMASTGPCKEVIRKGDQADLSKIPVPKHSDIDAGRYIGSGMCITKDPDTGIRNVACLRIQVKGPRHTGVMMVPRHTGMHYKRYEDRGRPMPFAVAIGPHPCLDIATNISTAYGVDEIELGAALLGEPVELVKCETIDLEVPAHCEVVIEGLMPPKLREEEGPFGEFTNYISGEGRNPTWEVTAITMRRDPIYRHINSTSFTDHQVLVGIPMEAGLYNKVKDVPGIEVHDVHVPSWGSLWLVLIQMTTRYEGQARDVMLGALSSTYLHPKIVVALDPDVDIYSPQDVMWAISTRVNPAKDVFTIPDMRIHPMDISCPEISPPGETTWQRVGGKMGIDATKPSLFRKQERERFRRCKPMGWGEVLLRNFVDNPDQIRQ